MSSQAAFTGTVVPSILILSSVRAQANLSAFKHLLSLQHLSFSLLTSSLLYHPLSRALDCLLVVAHLLSSLGLEGSIFIYIGRNCSLIVPLTWRSLWIKWREVEQRQTRVIAVCKHFICSVEAAWVSMSAADDLLSSPGHLLWSPPISSRADANQTATQYINTTGGSSTVNGVSAAPFWWALMCSQSKWSPQSSEIWVSRNLKDHALSTCSVDGK